MASTIQKLQKYVESVGMRKTRTKKKNVNAMMMENVFCLQLSFSVHECSNYEKTDHLFDQFIRCTYDAAQYCRIYIYICECVYFI